MEERDLTYQFKLRRSKMMLVYLQSAPVVNQPYYFQHDSEIQNSRITSVELVEAGVLSDGNVAGQVNGYNFMVNTDLRAVCLYMADAKGNVFIDQMPIRCWSPSFIGGTSNFGKKYRTDLRIDPSSSYIIWKAGTPFTTFPAVVAINVTLGRK